MSWSLTPSALDTADLFLEQVRVLHDDAGDVSYQYLHSITPGEEDNKEEEKEEGSSEVWEPALLRREVIIVRPVKRETVSSEVILDCLETARGVVIPPGSMTAFSGGALNSRQSHLALAAVDRRHPLRVSHWHGLNSAQSWGDFNAALRDMHALSWNALYADTSGNIGSRVTGR
jgi:acyl-homoserine lactone acylase PvdQ